jgi:hypothetical protein
MAQRKTEGPLICQCGCGEPIPPKRWHKYKPPRYIREHFNRVTKPHTGHRHSQARIPPGTICACGCEAPIPELTDKGDPRYAQSVDGRFYLPGHAQRGRKGATSNRWSGGRTVTSRGHVMLHRPDHPGANKHGYIAEHRLIWEEVHGRRLESDEYVYHINGVPDDNRPENLVAVRHARVTAKEPRTGRRPRRSAPTTEYSSSTC